MRLRDMKYIGFKHQRKNKQNSDNVYYLLCIVWCKAVNTTLTMNTFSVYYLLSNVWCKAVNTTLTMNTFSVYYLLCNVWCKAVNTTLTMNTFSVYYFLCNVWCSTLFLVLFCFCSSYLFISNFQACSMLINIKWTCIQELYYEWSLGIGHC